MKKDVMRKIILIIMCFLPILMGAALYKVAVAVQMGMGFVSFLAGVLILIFQKDIKEFKSLSMFQFIGKMIGHALAGILYLRNVSGDEASQAIFTAMALGAAIVFLIQFVIGYFISKGLARNR